MRLRCCLILLLYCSVPLGWAQEAPFWSPVEGPYGGVGVAALATMADGAVLAGTPGGVYRSTDQGTTWAPDGEGLTIPDVRALLVLADGTQLAGLFGDGVFTRRPGASTWAPSGLRQTFTTALLAAPDGRLYAGTAGGLLRSNDGGLTWTVLTLDPSQEVGVQALAANSRYIFAATPTGVYRSADGVGWTFVGTGLETPNVTALATNARGTVFAGTSPLQGGCTLYRSRNDGALWTCAEPSGGALQIQALAVDADDRLFAGGLRLIYRSTNEGESWQQAPAADVAVLAFTFTGTYALAGTAGRGVMRSLDEGAGWEPANTGLPSAITDLAVDDDRGDLYVATPGGVYRTEDLGASWMLLDAGLATPDVRALAFDDVGRLVAATPVGAFRYDQGAGRWEALGPDGSPTLRDLARASVLGTVYAAAFQGVYRLRGTAWELLPLVGPDDAARDVVAVGVGGTGTVYAAGNFETFRLESDDPATWTLLDAGGDLFSARTFATRGGLTYVGTPFLGVLSTADGGATWQPVGSGLPDRPDVRGLAVDAEGTLHAALFGSGLYRLGSDGTWTPQNEGLASLRFQTLAFDEAGNGFAGTFARGLVRHLAGGSVATEASEVPERFALHAAYPNPFNPQTTLRYDVPTAGPVRLTVYDALGRRVAVLVDEGHAAGRHRVPVEAGTWASGLYLVRMEAEGFAQTQRLVLVK